MPDGQTPSVSGKGTLCSDATFTYPLSHFKSNCKNQ